MNRWNIPAQLERAVLARDLQCVYCGVRWDLPSPRRGQRPSWEHIVNDARIITAANIARCCIACNASKGAKPLRTWMKSDYCASRGITQQTMAAVVQDALQDTPQAP